MKSKTINSFDIYSVVSFDSSFQTISTLHKMMNKHLSLNIIKVFILFIKFLNEILITPFLK